MSVISLRSLRTRNRTKSRLLFALVLILDRHVVTGWAVTMDPKKKEMVYEINFKRLGSEPSIDVVLRRPFSDEVEDYREYKRLRQMVRAKLDEVTQSKAATSPTLKFTSDGTTDEDDVDTSENELHDSFTQNTTNDAYSTK